ncbi:GPO family capsid scaffolding protein [Kosakonia sacchari]|uniref:GPO family capsid scaffolding protein n=1 Tax=Kosakonia sacchari TaxID=1158459 RepID=UPI002ACE8B5D|nr:GPO family capsid scaffolding protein [Kosakonia sacchari]MDZ7322960.1 GPO family capsid scaffolding protein [Kosakonia sacchari]
MTTQLVSDWICICTAGTAIDGRPIEESWLLEAAERYDTNFYVALIWPHHTDSLKEREYYTPNYGVVKALKTERVDGDLKLYAKFAPNQFLINANKESQKLFTSCEFWENFQGQGFTYLQAVVATDIPASVGTDMMKFSAQVRNQGIRFGNSNQFSLGELSPDKQPSLIDRIISGMTNRKFTPDKPAEEQDNMNADELKDILQQMLQAAKAMTDAAKGRSTSDVDDAAEEVRQEAEEIVLLAEEVAELAGEVAANPEDEVAKEEFTARRTDFTVLVNEFAKGNRQFSARRRRVLREFSASRKPVTQKQDVTATVNQDDKLDQVITLLSAAVGTSKTPLPGNAPGGSETKRSVL